MKKAILGKKIGMTQVFTEDGQSNPCFRYPGRTMSGSTEKDRRS